MKPTLIVSTATLLTLAGSAMAQHTNSCNKAAQCDKTSQSTITQPHVATSRLASFQPEEHSKKIVMVQTYDDHEYKVVIEDGNTQAWVDGEKVAKNNLKVDDDSIRILDDDGHTLTEFPRGMQITMGMPGTPPLLSFDHYQNQQHLRPDKDHGVIFYDDDPDYEQQLERLQAQEDNHPPVMLGIQMGVVDEDTADKLDIDREESIRVMKVLDGLPADKAGLKKGDIIVRIDGEPAVDLAKALNDKKPGQKVKLRIIRGDHEKTVTVKLAPWDGDALGINQYQTIIPQGGSQDDAAIKELIEKIEKLQNQHGDEDYQHEIEKLLKNFFKNHTKTMQWQGLPGDLDFPPIQRFGDNGQIDLHALLDDDGKLNIVPRVFVEPDRSPSREMRQYRQRLDALEDQLNTIEDKLDTIIDYLNEHEELDDD